MSAKISFDFPTLEFIFKELFYKKGSKEIQKNIIIKEGTNKNQYADLMYLSRWITIEFNEAYFSSKLYDKKNIIVSDFIHVFLDYLFLNLKGLNDNEFLFKITVSLKNHTTINFLFKEIKDMAFFKTSYSSALQKIIDYKRKGFETVREVKKAFKSSQKSVYYELEKDKWKIVDILYNAGKYHHDTIAKNIVDNRISKPDILVNADYLGENIKYKALWQISARKRKYVRIKPNDIAIYSSIARKNLNKAIEIYNDDTSGLWKYIQFHDDETNLMDYYELVISSIILAYSSIEALVNIAIPRNYVHKRLEKNKKTGKMVTKKYNKYEIERWYNLEDKMNIILPKALGIPLPNQQKWWQWFKKLHDIRNKIVHTVDSKSNERYSELLEKQIFRIIKSHEDIIRFLGVWATEKKHYLLNELPYGFGCDDIMPILISDEHYNQVMRERKGLNR